LPDWALSGARRPVEDLCGNAQNREMVLRALALAVLVLAATPVQSLASLGTGVGASPITLARPAEPGKTYQLPSLYVVNTGTEASYYGVRAERISQGSQRPIPPAWVTFAKNHFQLQPQQGIQVPLILTVPGDARPGDYMTNLVAGTMPANQTSGVALGAAAATQLVFTVAEPTGFQFPWPWAWWVWALMGFGLLVGAGLLLYARGFRLEVERRR